MLFLIYSNANMQFIEKELEQKSYTTLEILSTTKKIELINKRKFAITALDKNAKTFMVYVTILLAILIMQVHFFYQAQIGLLFTFKVFTKVLYKYLSYIIFFDLMIELPQNIGINEHTIKLIKSKQLSYKLIWSLKSVKLEVLKI